MYGTVLVALVLVILGMLAASYMTHYFMKQAYEKVIKHTKDLYEKIMSEDDCEVELGFEDDDDDEDDEEEDDDDGGRFRPTNRVSEYFN